MIAYMYLRYQHKQLIKEQPEQPDVIKLNIDRSLDTETIMLYLASFSLLEGQLNC